MIQSPIITCAMVGALLVASFALGFAHGRDFPTCQPRPIPTHTL